MMSPEGEDFTPSESYTDRLHGILEDYPAGLQVLREILQNSDDAKSTEQIFILDHNKYLSNSLFKPGHDRYQGPALLAKNNGIFTEKDFNSLRKLAKSEKRDQFDKIGVMGLGFNSIYHLTDYPSFITGDKYVILDPHNWFYNGGQKFSYIEKELADKYPDQFAPFKIPCDEPNDSPFKKPFEGTIFRYPLRNSKDSEIIDTIYESQEILNMFDDFYKKESINCLLFLKYIECIKFYELKEGATKLDLLYTIQLENADQVRQQRRLIAENIVPMMNSLKSKEPRNNNHLEISSYIALFSRKQKRRKKETNPWLILNYLNDLLETEKFFQENIFPKGKIRKSIGDYKFIPNVGLAVPLNDLNITGNLFCFLPLPIDTPFSVSVHGYFAITTNRHNLWSARDIDGMDGMANHTLARLKVRWNLYLFEEVLPKAWAKFLRELPFQVSNIQSKDLYKFWPIAERKTSGTFYKNLLQNVIENLSIDDCVFPGPSSSINVGTLSIISSASYDMSSFKKSDFYWLSLRNGYLEDESSFTLELHEIIRSIGFPVMSCFNLIVKGLKASKHKRSLKAVSPAVIRTFLKLNYDRWNDGAIPRKEVLQLFEYILKDKNFSELEGFKIIPLADGSFGTLNRSRNSNVYISPKNNTIFRLTNIHFNECDIFKDQLSKFIDTSIDSGLYNILYENAKSNWNLNIKILDESVVAEMIKFSLNYTSCFNTEINMSNNRDWIYKLWDYLKYRNWNLKFFEDIYLIPTNRSTLRKLKTPQKIFSNEISNKNIIPILEKFGAIFVDKKFDDKKYTEWITPYIIKLDDIISVLSSIQVDPSYPKNLNRTLQNDERLFLINYLSMYIQQHHYAIEQKFIDVIKQLPIYIEVDHNSPISLYEYQNWYLLPREEENSYGKIIYPKHKGRFLSADSQHLCYILENIINIRRLNVNEYWQHCVIPYLELQSQKNMDIIVEKLFDRLPFLQRTISNFEKILGNKSFVPAGTLNMSKLQKLPNDVKLIKPIDLFNTEDKTITDLFFENELVFPAGKYGMSRYLSNLKFLGIKKSLSSNDIVSRINTIVNRIGGTSKFCRIRALNLFKYIDNNWDRLNNDRNTSLKDILNNRWIPTSYESGIEVFSKPEDCYIKKYKNLVCYVAPVLDYNPINMNFLKYLNWHTYPDVKVILKQLDCIIKKYPPKDLEPICNTIYEYMDIIFQNDKTSFDYMKKNLKNKSWILCGNTFRSSDKVITNVPDELNGNDTFFTRLPLMYTVKFKELFEAMGVRDEVGVEDLILIIQNKRNEIKHLSTDEINNVVQVLEQIVKIQKKNKSPKSLDGLLIPSTKGELVDLKEIHYDDMDNRLDNEKKSEYKIAHSEINLYIAKELNMQTLAGKICDTGDGWEPYEQSESLITRIKDIIRDYSSSQLIKEFLQNADDAKATDFSVIIDRRQNNDYKKSLLSKGMEDLQGPAIWIYNNVEFSEHDFQSLLKIGIGGKSRDEDENDTRIGKFGKGFNCAFHITDLPSFVSGEIIAFIDPHAKFLPATGYPPKRFKGKRMNFIENEFKKMFPDQCHPYEFKGCDFTKKFEGTLFRLPLRTKKLALESKISNKIFEIDEIRSLLFDSKEMLFLRNIESCSLYDIQENTPLQLIWQAKIKNSSYRDIRKKIIDSIDNAQIYRLDILIEEFENERSKKISEIWAICTGGHEKIKPELKDYSKVKRLKPRAGIAALLAKSDEKSLDELKSESFPNPPKLKGEIFSYLSLSMKSNLGVHLNGNFSLSSARLQFENDFAQSQCDNAKWNRYILLEVLPDLHIKLFEYIVKLEKARYKNMRERSNFISHIRNNFWPINEYLSGSFKDYGLNVIRKLGYSKQKFLWTEANGGKFVSLHDARILELKKTNISNILINLKNPIQVVELEKDKMAQLDEIIESRKPSSFPYMPICGKLLCEELKLRKPYKGNIIRDDNNHDSLFQLLTFILQDKGSFESLNGLPLVPLSDGSVGEFGEKIYYIGKQKHLNLFPNSGLSKFISIDLPKNLLEIFSNEEFSKITNIQKFDDSAVLVLLKDELPDVDILPWNPNDISIPNKNWLNKIWSMLTKSEENIEGLSKFPLLPVTKPYNILIRPKITNPILYENEQHSLFSVLVKLRVRFTNMIFTESAHENLKQCVIQCTPVNIINSLEKALSYTNLESIQQLFENSNLSSSDCLKFRTFIKEELKTLIEYGQTQANFMKILASLPIWPVNSHEDNFIDARSGILLPYSLPFFSFREKNDIYKCDHESDFITLKVLGAVFISELDYVKRYILPDFTRCPIPPKNYMPFLLNLLLLQNSEIENYLKRRKVIPNKSLTEFVCADNLYDTNNPLFRSIFADTDKVLPSELQSSDCLEALGRIGLKREVNNNTYVECVLEIESQIRRETVPSSVIKDRAKDLVRYLYDHIDTFDFNSLQWNKIQRTQFVPSKKVFQGQLYQNHKEASLFESFEKLCSQKYKDICWTQCPLFDESVEPTLSFNNRYPEIELPPTESIIEHWFVIERMSKQNFWSGNVKRQLKNVINEIYKVMNEISKVEVQKLSVKLKINNPNRKIFLNGDDPFDEENWVAGKDLVFGLQKDIKEGMYKVKDCIKEYKELLILAGASELEPPKPPSPDPIFDQKNKLFENLLDKFIRQSNNEYHDVIFIVDNEKIAANRYVLSAASTYFEKMFCGGLSESIENKTKVKVDDIKPDIFRVFLQWLYGQPVENSINCVLRKRDEFATEESYETYYLSCLIDLLKVTDYYGVELKGEIEDMIINGSHINVVNVCDILRDSKKFNAARLENYCKEYINSNRHLVIKQLSDTNEGLQILDSLLSNSE